MANVCCLKSFFFSFFGKMPFILDQRLALEMYFPAEFSSNLDQTHLPVSF